MIQVENGCISNISFLSWLWEKGYVICLLSTSLAWIGGSTEWSYHARSWAGDLLVLSWNSPLASNVCSFRFHWKRLYLFGELCIVQFQDLVILLLFDIKITVSTISSTSSSSFTERNRGLLWRLCIKVSQENMVTNLQAELVPLSLGNGTGFVHRGFQAPWLRLGSTRRVENSNYNGLGMKWCDRCV